MIKPNNQQGLKAIGGMEFREEDTLLFIGIARNNEGFRELNECRINFDFNRTKSTTAKSGNQRLFLYRKSRHAEFT